MSKEEAERSSALGRASSMPPRAAVGASASEPPRSLPSTPPSTDDIDTDWGAEPEAPAPAAAPVAPVSLAPPVAAQVEVAASTPAPVAPAVVVAPAPVSIAPPAHPSSPPAREASTRPNALRSQTLIGLPPPRPPSSAPPPAREAALRQSRLRSQTLIGMAVPAPPARTSEPPPVRRSSVPPPPRTSSLPPPAPTSAADVADVRSAPEKTRSSVPPPLPPPAPSIVSSAPPAAAANKGVTSTFRAPPSAAPVAADAAPNKRSGRGIVWLAVACTLIGGLGYVIFHRPHTVTVAQMASELSPPAPPIASAPPEELAPTPAPVATDEPPASAAPATSAAPAASADASADAPTPGTITVTVDTVPPKARFYHYGKEVGVAPFVVELKPGERHAYEVGLPGHVTRKLVLDGTKTQITIGLRDDAETLIRRPIGF